MAGKNAREVALDALTAWQTGGVWSDRRLSDAIVKAGLDRRDSALATYLCGGVIQNLLLLDYHIGRHSSIKLKKLETRSFASCGSGRFSSCFPARFGSAAVTRPLHCAKARTAGLRDM